MDEIDEKAIATLARHLVEAEDALRRHDESNPQREVAQLPPGVQQERANERAQLEVQVREARTAYSDASADR
jgi:hypothetical protein